MPSLLCRVVLTQLQSYMNVYKSRKASGQSPFTPLLYLLPFPVATSLQLIWLSHPSVGDSAIIYSDVLIPFMCAWGLQFAHQLGRMILAHVTKMDFPYWDSLWIWSFIGALDANLPRLIGRYVYILVLFHCFGK